jgi:hypothetical protein
VIFFKINIFFCLVLILCLPLFRFLFLNMSSTPRFKSGIVHQQRRPLPLPSSKLPLILHYMRAADLLGFPSPQIGMIFLLSLSRLLLIILMYRLKQAPRAWFEKFRTTLLHLAFTQSQYFFARLPLGSLYFLCMLMIL